MENIVCVDNRTPIGGDNVDVIPPYIRGGHCGQLTGIPYKDGVAGPSPVPPTIYAYSLCVILELGVFVEILNKDIVLDTQTNIHIRELDWKLEKYYTLTSNN
ncbi:MAG TPA: hypothetical protein VKF38_02400 [Anaerolineaceae bacterium]|nr:hypothetical protein [Anaerolineaceae bacterium]